MKRWALRQETKEKQIGPDEYETSKILKPRAGEKWGTLTHRKVRLLQWWHKN